MERDESLGLESIIPVSPTMLRLEGHALENDRLRRSITRVTQSLLAIPLNHTQQDAILAFSLLNERLTIPQIAETVQIQEKQVERLLTVAHEELDDEVWDAISPVFWPDNEDDDSNAGFATSSIRDRGCTAHPKFNELYEQAAGHPSTIVKRTPLPRDEEGNTLSFRDSLGDAYNRLDPDLKETVDIAQDEFAYPPDDVATIYVGYSYMFLRPRKTPEEFGEEHGMTAETVAGHRDYAYKEVAGERLVPAIRYLKRRVEGQEVPGRYPNTPPNIEKTKPPAVKKDSLVNPEDDDIIKATRSEEPTPRRKSPSKVSGTVVDFTKKQADARQTITAQRHHVDTSHITLDEDITDESGDINIQKINQWVLREFGAIKLQPTLRSIMHLALIGTPLAEIAKRFQMKERQIAQSLALGRSAIEDQLLLAQGIGSEQHWRRRYTEKEVEYEASLNTGFIPSGDLLGNRYIKESDLPESL